MSMPAAAITGQDQSQIQDFAGRVRAKFPGAYDDLDDVTLAQKVVARHPEYTDMLPKSVTTMPDQLTRQTAGAARAGGAAPTRAPAPAKMEPSGMISRFVSGMVSGAKAMIPGAPDKTSIALSGMGPLPGMMRAAAQGYEQSRDEGQGVLPSVASGAASLAGINAPGVRERAKAGDVAGVIGEGVPAVVASLLAPRVIEKAPEIARGAGDIVKAPYRMVVKGQPPDFVVPAAPEAMRQAIQPSVRVPRAEESIGIAGPRMQQIRTERGIEIPEKGPEAMKAVMDLNREAKTQILGAIEQRMGPVADLKPDVSGVAKAIRNSVDDITLEREPGAKDAVERAAGTYEREGGNAWSIRQMENRMHTLNNRLANIYSQVTPGEARIPVEGEIALTEAKALRTRIDEAVENLSGAGVKELKREYGAQRDVEKSLARQYAVASRQKGVGLWPGLAALQIAGDFTSPSALAVGTMARMLKTLRDPGYLLNRSFHGPDAFEAAKPFGAAPGPNIRGLLPRGSLMQGPAPDTSGPVDIGKPQVEWGTRALRKGLLLPEKTGQALDPTERGPVGGPGPNQVPSAFQMARSSVEHPDTAKIIQETGRTEPGGKAGMPRQRVAPDLDRDARQEVESLHALWSDLPKPGRFVHNATEVSGGATQDRPDTVAYGIKSPKPSVEAMFPWLRDLPMMTLSRVKAALEKGTGVDYERIVRAAKEHLAKERGGS